MGRGLDELLGLVLLLVEHVLVLHREVVAVAAGDRVAEGLPLQGQLPGADVHDLHVLGAVHRVCKTHARHGALSRPLGRREGGSAETGEQLSPIQPLPSRCHHLEYNVINIFL